MVDVKKFLVLGILGLFMISMMGGIVSADSAWDDLKGFFTSGDEDSALGMNFAKILLIALVAMIVYSIAAVIPFVSQNDGVRWSISIIIAVLSFLFISVADIRYILINYQALGVALTTFIPLVIIILFTWEFRKKSPAIAGVVNKLILTLFILYSGWNWLNLDVGVSALKWMYPLTVIIAIVWLIFEKWVYFKMAKSFLRGEVSEAGDLYVTHLAAKQQKILDQLDSAGPETAAKLQKELNSLEAKIKKAEQR